MKASILYEALAAMDEARQALLQNEIPVQMTAYKRLLNAQCRLDVALDKENLIVPVEREVQFLTKTEFSMLNEGERATGTGK